jgi:hypothetical protein
MKEQKVMKKPLRWVCVFAYVPHTQRARMNSAENSSEEKIASGYRAATSPQITSDRLS